MLTDVICIMLEKVSAFRARSLFFGLDTLIALCLMALISACSDPSQLSKDIGSTDNSNSTLDSTVIIYRDDYGTPHVFAETNYGTYFGFGYAVATDRLFQMEMLKRTVQGRVAEVLGNDFLELDKHIRTAYDHRAIKRQLENLNTQSKEILDAYAQGFSKRVNEVLKDQEALLPGEYGEFGFLPETWTSYDVVMIFVGSIIHRYSDFNSELDNLSLLNSLTERHGSNKAQAIFDASKWVVDTSSPTTVPRGKKFATTPLASEALAKKAVTKKVTPLLNENSRIHTRRIVFDDIGRFVGTTDEPLHKQALEKQIATSGFNSPEFTPASNFWSVTGAKLSDADGALVNGPQFGFGLPSYVYGIGLHGGDFNVVGNTLLGLPSILFAHNGHIAWGSTAGLSDQVDVFQEQLVEGKENHYWHNKEAKPFETWNETIKVKGGESVVVAAKRSVHGMVITSDAENNVAYARARAWEGKELASLVAWIDLSKQKDLDSAQSVLAGVGANINFYYMDVKGNHGYTHGGRYPQRTKEHDSRLPAKGTGEFDWLGYRPFTDNPSTRNPEQGYIVNWNNRPAADWLAIDLWSYTWSKADRVSHIIAELDSRDVFSVEDLWSIVEKVSYDDVSVTFLLPYLFDIKSFDGASDEAIKRLKAWDREWRLHDDGRYGAAELIVERWSKNLFNTVLKDDVGPEKFGLYSATNNPNGALGPSMLSSVGAKVILRNLQTLTSGRNDYDFFNGTDPSMVLKQTFDATIKQLISEHGDELNEWSLPAAEMVWKPYNFRGVPQASTNRTIKLPAYMNRGSENNFFIARDGRFEAYDVVPPGQSGFISKDDAESQYVSDQMKLFSDFQYKLIPFSLNDVKSASKGHNVVSIKRRAD